MPDPKLSEVFFKHGTNAVSTTKRKGCSLLSMVLTCIVIGTLFGSFLWFGNLALIAWRSR